MKNPKLKFVNIPHVEHSSLVITRIRAIFRTQRPRTSKGARRPSTSEDALRISANSSATVGPLDHSSCIDSNRTQSTRSFTPNASLRIRLKLLFYKSHAYFS